MTPILSLHNVDVTKFLAVLDTCEGNVYLVRSKYYLRKQERREQAFQT